MTTPNYEPFPKVDPGITPVGNCLLIQIKTPKLRTKTGLILADVTRESELWNIQLGKVIKIGPLAFRDRKTMNEWPEGAWVKVGDLVRFPQRGGDRWCVARPNEEDVYFGLFRDTDITGRVDDDFELTNIRDYV